MTINDNLCGANMSTQDEKLWDKFFMVERMKYHDRPDSIEIVRSILCVNIVNRDDPLYCLWDRYYAYVNRESTREYMMFGDVCNYCSNQVYFTSKILDELTKGGMVEYENKLAAYYAEFKRYGNMYDSDDDIEYDCRLCISCKPFYSYKWVPDEYSKWYDDGHSGYDHYYYEYSKKSDIGVARHLANVVESDVSSERQEIYIFLKERMNIIREDLVKVVFHPKRYSKYIDMNYNIFTDSYEYDL